jgi:2-phosphosulfolactate phosphatase
MDPQSPICSKPIGRRCPAGLVDDTSAAYHARAVQVLKVTGIDGARRARGVVVVIDVLRSFTVSAYALAGGARECLLVTTVDEARRLAASVPEAVICAEENALPVPGIAISNSPTQIIGVDLHGKSLIQRSSAGTQAVSAAADADETYAASLVVARATAKACRSSNPSLVTLVASADFPEDHACAAYLEALLNGEPPPELRPLLEPLFDSDRYRKISAGQWPGFPSNDVELSLELDRFDFAMPVTRADDHLRLVRQPPQTPAARPAG